jgi:hypothetical protein
MMGTVAIKTLRVMIHVENIFLWSMGWGESAKAVKFIFPSKIFFCWFLQKPVLRIRTQIRIQFRRIRIFWPLGLLVRIRIH